MSKNVLPKKGDASHGASNPFAPPVEQPSIFSVFWDALWQSFVDLMRRAHGIELKRVASGIIIVVVGAFAITAKNLLFAGLTLEESLLAMVPTLLVKGMLGYYYPLIRDPIIRKFERHLELKLLAESVAYAILQTTSFLCVVAFLIPPSHLPQAGAWTFATSLLMGKPVGFLIDMLTQVLTRLREKFSV